LSDTEEPRVEGRNETFEERLDRNWMELLQELRVLQTGVQLVAGFLLTLPFRPGSRPSTTTRPASTSRM
jgi:hypothetical protein